MNEDSLGAGKFVGFLREKNKIFIILGALILGICLIFMPVGEKKGTDDYDLAVEKLEGRVGKLCGEIRGVSEVSVMITLDTVGETKYAQNSQVNKDAENVNTRYEYVSGSQGLLPIAEVTPRVRGVAVVCTGGGNPDVQLKLTELLCALFGIPSSAVSVVEGK